MTARYLRAVDLPGDVRDGLLDDIPDDVRKAVCNGGGPAAGVGAYLVPDLIGQWVRVFNRHDWRYALGGTWIDRLVADWLMVREMLAGVGDWLEPDRESRLVKAASRGGARGWAAWLAFAGWSLGKLIVAVVLAVLAILVYYVAVRIGGGSRWLGSWKYRDAPATAGEVVAEVRQQIEQRARVGER